MAKSLRCKHRIRMRNIKRQSYAKKDLERLKILAAKSSEMKDIVTLRSPGTGTSNLEKITKETCKEEKIGEGAADASMDVDKTAKVVNKKTLQDENGHYPAWMNQRAVKKQKQKVHKLKIKKKSGKVSKTIKW